jgi:hypothetical protein
MKRAMSLLALLVAVSLAASSGHSQSNVAAELNGETLLPIGTYHMPGSGYGGGIGLQYDLGEYFSIGFHAGYAVWSLKNGRLENWPLSFPLKYYFLRPDAFRVYGLIEPGYTFTRKMNELTISPGVGAEIPLRRGVTALDCSLRYEKHLNGSQTNGINCRLGSLFGF